MQTVCILDEINPFKSKLPVSGIIVCINNTRINICLIQYFGRPVLQFSYWPRSCEYIVIIPIISYKNNKIQLIIIQ